MCSAISLPTQMGFDSPDGAKPGEGCPRRLTQDGPPTESKFGPSIDNLYAMFARSAKANGGNNCFGYRPVLDPHGPMPPLGDFTFSTYEEVHKKVLLIGSGVASLGLSPKAGFGMYSANSSDFQAITLGCFSQGLTCVPIYDTLGDNIVQYEVNHAELPILFCEASKLKSVAGVLKACPTLKYVVQMNDLETTPADPKVLAAFEEAEGVSLIDLKTLVDKGTTTPVEPKPAGPDDLAFIMYTSGTTGDPKGVCIKQKSITVGASWCAGIELYATDRYLSFLPLAHIFETMVEHAILSVGGSVGFFNGNIKRLSEDILALKPTLFVGVPRVYQRFYEAAHQKISAFSNFKKNLVTWLLDTETVGVRSGKKSWKGKILAKALGAKVHGGCVRLMISGAAPLPVHVQEFLLAAMGAQVVQGYGMTENCANATLAYLDDYRAGHVGPPMPTVEVKLVDVPEMNYTTAANRSGEVCTKGLVNFVGYHKNKEETDKVLEADGWLHTGDIGRWNPDGTLSIIDRKKNIFKLAQGEYVASEKIEMIVSKSKYVAQPWIYGNSFFPMLVAVVTPDWGELKQAAQAGGWFVDDQVALAAKPEAKKFILDQMIAEGKAAKLKTFELPTAVVLEPEINDLNQGFSIDNDCLTPTFKLKRPQLLRRYQTQIDEMYISLGQDPSKNKI